MQDNDTFSKDIVKLINEKKLSSPHRYIVHDEKLLDRIVREDNISFHVLIMPHAVIKYICCTKCVIL